MGRFTSTPYLVLFVILAAAGISTASAMITITFDGFAVFKDNVQIDKDLNVEGTITGNGSLASLSCATDQIAKFDGDKWVCSDEIFLNSFGCMDGQIPIFSGPKMFVVGTGGDAVHQYTLSTAFDVSSASFVDSFSVNTETTSPTGVAFSPNGTKMFVSQPFIYEYALSTAFVVSSASFVDSVNPVGGGGAGLTFSPNGTMMFVVGSGAAVYQHTLSTAFNVSSASFVDSFSVLEDTAPQDVKFNPDGTKMFILGSAGKAVYEYTLSTAFNVSSASFVDSFSVGSEESFPLGIAFDGQGRWICTDLS